ncbi:hypothetical protein BDA96_03G129200 [Sorghum bicolor]|uniref:Dirigent protein n=2 Tax=Sorghum bicolor TaxID=4558 RepID=A0A921RCJ4_SORBI|nr:dirigent protein 1 [Sorghum bicolor]EES00538.1 hypothetical protein SORBI_3003G123700 [Sorghum bicolor]KAG0537214.1 hypothetical protein BDA96_03G129200 [Sorghum bicolor]|eukprot:XP_002455418.1 dirigent protein 1 [Sorghum bicolor]
MASCNKQLSSVLLAVLLALVAGGGAVVDAEHLHLYMHDVTGGPSPTAVRVVNAPRGYFGNMFVIDDALTEGASSSTTSRVVGRAQGYYMCASVANLELLVTMNVVLTSGPYAGSSVTVVGRDDINAPVRELSVVGGTGQFRMARGYVLWKTVTPEIIDLEIFVNP